ncbi:MAG: NAD(+)/NADH kinase [Parachlamydiaceae bacterium]
MLVALFPNLTKPSSLKVAMRTSQFLLNHGVKVVAEDSKAELLNLPQLSSAQPEQVDFLISMGGDGTILGMMHKHPELTAPVIGINLGGLGFMAEIPEDQVEVALQQLIGGEYTLCERLMVEGYIDGVMQALAINEIVIHRAKIPSLIDLSISVGSSYLNAFSSDGLIISTPTGSTAYNLASGGPILTPELSSLVITPICPHTISYRPIVLNTENKISVTYQSELPPVEVSYDGIQLHTLSTGQTLEILPSKRIFKTVLFKGHDFFSTLRSKLGWTGRLRFPLTKS